MVCSVLRRVVVDTWVDCCAADRAAPTGVELLEYWEYLFAMLAAGFVSCDRVQATRKIPDEALYAATSILHRSQTNWRIDRRRKEFRETSMLPRSMAAVERELLGANGLLDDQTQ
jgi:hypothetical protein